MWVMYNQAVVDRSRCRRRRPLGVRRRWQRAGGYKDGSESLVCSWSHDTVCRPPTGNVERILPPSPGHRALNDHCRTPLDDASATDGIHWRTPLFTYSRIFIFEEKNAIFNDFYFVLNVLWKNSAIFLQSTNSTHERTATINDSRGTSHFLANSKRHCTVQWSPNVATILLYSAPATFNDIVTLIFTTASTTPVPLRGSNAPWFMCWFRRYVNCSFVCLLNFIPPFPPSLLSSLLMLSSLLICFLYTCLLLDWSTPSRIDPFHFQAEGRRRRPNLALVFFWVNFML